MFRTIVRGVSDNTAKFCRSVSTMRFLRFKKNDSVSVGVELEQDGDIMELPSSASSDFIDMRRLIEGGEQSLATVKRMVDNKSGTVIKRSDVKIMAPITNPDKVLCIGMNYKDHCEEQNAPVPVEPVIFNKFPSCIIGPYDDIRYPEETKELDWEVELTIVVGKKAKNIAEANAMDYIFGYTVAHDVSARDWQMGKGKNGGQWVLGKAMDDFCPLGPAIVTKDSLSDPHNLTMNCVVNGVTKQDSNTNQLVHKSAACIAFISRFMTLMPGDLILTGTPPGVGVFRKPPEFLKKGDVVDCEIAEIGKITNKIV